MTFLDFPTDDEYEMRCRRAATAQGCDPIVEALHRAEVPAEVWQTGGFCMVVHVPCRDKADGYVWVTQDGDEEWIVCLYPAEDNDDDLMGQEAIDTYYLDTLDEVVSTVIELVTPMPNLGTWPT